MSLSDTYLIQYSHLSSYYRPKPPEEKEEDTEIIDEESELNLDRIEEEMAAAYSGESDDDNYLLLDNLYVSKKPENVERKIDINLESWQLELERVLPQLKITIKNESRDWRSHLDQMKSHKENIETSFGSTKTQLLKLHKEVTVVLDKIGSREKYLNRELETVLGEYRILQDQLSHIKDNYAAISGGVSERNRELSKLTDRLETVKQQMEERGSSMTDGSKKMNYRILLILYKYIL